MAVNSELLSRIKCYVKLQWNFSTKILYCYLNIEQSCKNSDVDFLKLRMLTVFLYLLKHKFFIHEKLIFPAVYGIKKLKLKTCFSQTSKAKKFFPLN